MRASAHCGALRWEHLRALTPISNCVSCAASCGAQAAPDGTCMTLLGLVTGAYCSACKHSQLALALAGQLVSW